MNDRPLFAYRKRHDDLLLDESPCWTCLHATCDVADFRDRRYCDDYSLSNYFKEQESNELEENDYE